MSRFNSKELISQYVTSLLQKDVDYEITKYYYQEEVTEKVNHNFSGVNYFIKIKKQRYRTQYYQRRKEKNNLQPVPRWSSDGRQMLILLTELRQRVNILPITDKKYLVSTENFSTTNTFTAAIARLFLMEFYYKEDFLPHQV